MSSKYYNKKSVRFVLVTYLTFLAFELATL